MKGVRDEATDTHRWLLDACATQLHEIVELCPDGVACFDARGVPQHVNAAWLQMLCLRRASAFDLDLDAADAWIGDLLSPAAPHRRPLSATLRDPRLAAGLTLQFERPRRSCLRLTQVRTSAGGSLFYLRDVTHEAERERMKSELLTTAAHELRSPMASVFGFTELLLKRPVPEDRRRDLLETIHRQSTALVQVVDDLLDLSRIEARQGRDFLCLPCRVGDLVADAASAIAAEGRGRRLQLDLSHASAEVVVDRDKTRRAIANVLSAAFKRSPPGAVVCLSTCLGRLDGQAAAGVSVRADLAHDAPGHGLGMALVEQIVELQQGQVEAHSTPGQGAEVTLWWPVHPRATAAPASARITERA